MFINNFIYCLIGLDGRADFLFFRAFCCDVRVILCRSIRMFLKKIIYGISGLAIYPVGDECMIVIAIHCNCLYGVSSVRLRFARIVGFEGVLHENVDSPSAYSCLKFADQHDGLINRQPTTIFQQFSFNQQYSPTTPIFPFSAPRQQLNYS